MTLAVKCTGVCIRVITHKKTYAFGVIYKYLLFFNLGYNDQIGHCGGIHTGCPLMLEKDSLT